MGCLRRQWRLSGRHPGSRLGARHSTGHQCQLERRPTLCRLAQQGDRAHYQLLSEAQWEYAARAGSRTYFSFGNDDAQLDKYAWLPPTRLARPTLTPVRTLSARRLPTPSAFTTRKVTLRNGSRIATTRLTRGRQRTAHPGRQTSVSVTSFVAAVPAERAPASNGRPRLARRQGRLRSRISGCAPAQLFELQVVSPQSSGCNMRSAAYFAWRVSGKRRMISILVLLAKSALWAQR